MTYITGGKTLLTHFFKRNSWFL